MRLQDLLNEELFAQPCLISPKNEAERRKGYNCAFVPNVNLRSQRLRFRWGKDLDWPFATNTPTGPPVPIC